MGWDFFGRREFPKDELSLQAVNIFNEAVRFWEDDLASEIAVISAKLNFTKTEIERMTIQERRLYISKIQDMFGKKDPSHQPSGKSMDDRFPMSQSDKKLVEMHQNRLHDTNK